MDESSEDLGYELVFEDQPSVKHSFLARDGKATVKYPSGDIFVGEYRNLKRNGHGVYKFAGGGEYDGEYVNGAREGQGTLVMPDGSKYTGTFINNKREGHGVFVYSNGDRFEGGWKSDAKHGTGVYRFTSEASLGRVLAAADSYIEGTWSNGELLRGVLVMPDGARMSAVWHDGKLNGPSVISRANGNIQLGTFADAVWQPRSTIEAEAATVHSATTPAIAVNLLDFSANFLRHSTLIDSHCEGVHRLKKQHESLPNFHRVAPPARHAIASADEEPVEASELLFGVGPINRDGITALLERSSEAGAERTVIVSLRSEPQLFIGNVCGGSLSLISLAAHDSLCVTPLADLLCRP